MKLKFKLLFNPNDEENNSTGHEFNAQKDGIFLCGSLDVLGGWNLRKAVEMTPATSSPSPQINVMIDSANVPKTICPVTTLDIASDSYSPYSSISSASSIDFNPDNNFTVMANHRTTTTTTTATTITTTTGSQEFEATIEIDEESSDEVARINEAQGIQYKYFVAQKSSSLADAAGESRARPLFIKFVEYNWRHLEQEKLTSAATSTTIEVNDKWPSVDDPVSRPARIDSGWLIDEREHEMQFHFFDQPLDLWMSSGGGGNEEEKGGDTSLAAAATPDLAFSVVPFKHTSKGLVELKDYLVETNDFDENQTVHNRRTRFNALNEPGFYSTLRVRFREKPTDLVFQISVHELDENGRTREKQPLAAGFYKPNRYLLENSLIEVDFSMTSANQIVGTLKTEILLISGPKDMDNTHIKKNFNYHFNKSCIPIGHRGMGKTFDAGSLPGTSFVENTIESFREAYHRGAQMVEFDVVLTKDKIPIVYHDFVFCIDQLSGADKQPQTAPQESSLNVGSNKLLSLAVNQLTYDEVKQNRIYSQKILKKSNLSNELKEFFTSKLMFPTLKEMCSQLDPKLGFNVEIKYPIDLEDGSHEVENRLIKWLNRNEYVDCILKELYECCKDDNRCVILSCFDPNLCSMFRMKQNKFPVLFLTNGVTNKWVPYKDVRCKKTRMSFNFAKSENLHGIVAHAEELTKNLHLINILFNHASKSANFLAYSWGDDLNELDKRRFMSQSGVNGIIYDRIHESD